MKFPPSFLLILCCFFWYSIPITAQVVIGAVNTPQVPSYEVPPTDVLMPVTFSNGISTTFLATTTYNNFGNPYFIPLFGNPGISSAKIYVDLTTTQDDYVDIFSSCITTADIIAISTYILASDPSSLSSSQKIAADVNLDGNISIFDMVEIQRVVLGYQDFFRNSITVNGVTYNDVSAVYPTVAAVDQLNNALFNISYSCVYNYNPFPSNSLIGQNFMAIRLGDVNQTCDSFFVLDNFSIESYLCNKESSDLRIVI
ncbi:dockerin type I domain-containing protein [Neolewinella agarilytica]|uniref:dockerin type I domain-containing protein n=1 Tax=Neolewinella agarilytica TaxID=478744 RepID=UPI0023578060|nr:dockerin type I domain-containing protein [Neolewinella agarilytica]